MFKKFLVFVSFFILPLSLCAETINIFHTSDTHGFYFPRDKEGRSIGGYAALSAVLEKETQPYLLFDSGDYTSGTAEAKESKGLLSVQFMNLLKYNAAAVGNHEADFGESSMLSNIAAAKFDVLAANMRDTEKNTYLQNTKPYAFYQVKDKKIAVVGIAKDPIPPSKKIKTGADISALKKALAEIKEHKPDAVIVLFHGSIEDALYSQAAKFNRAAAKTGEVNLVLGGHVHKVVQNKKINNTYFVESGAELKGVSKVSLIFNDKTKKLEDIKSQYIVLDTQKTGQETKVKAFADKHYKKELDEKITTANERIYKYNHLNNGDIDSPLGNIFTDMIKAYTNAEIAMQNTEGLRMDIPKGAITKRLVFEVFPFPNKVMIVRADGAFIKNVILRSLRENRSLFQYSGLEVEYKYKHKRPEITKILINGQPLKAGKLYTIAINDYNAKGNSEGYMFKKITDKELFSDKYISELFIELLQKNPQGISPAPTGRIRKIN